MAAIEIPIIHGTVLNPNARRMPKSATLLNSMDSLLAFPSIQRYQLQKLKEREKSSENRPKIEDLDLNDNYLKHPSAPKSTYSQLNGIFSKSHGYLDTIGKYQRRYPPDQEADELATSASAYAAYERRPGQEGIDKIPHGFVSRQREIFSRQLILVEQQNESKSPSLSPLPPDTLRRKSAPTISVYVSKDNSISSTPNQTSSVSLEISPNRTSPSSISGNQSQVSGTNAKSPNQDHENVERQVHESVPSSSYLIWKSQEQIQKRRGSIPNQQSHSSGAESMESRPASQPEQTFRTIIMFPGKTTPTMTTPKKMSEIVEEKPKPHKVHPKSSEFLQNIKRTVSNASTASPETMLSPRTEDTSSPGSTPDLLKINSQQAENTQLSPATIRRNCERIMRIVQKYGCQIPEEEFDSFGESSSEASPEINSNMKSNFWSTHNFSKTDSIKHMSNQNPPEHGLHVEIPNFTKQNGFQNGHIENQMIKLKDEEIQRLQRELSDAHVCNQRLNSQLGVLASKESHITERELKKQLKERTNEVDQLKKRLEKLERDKKVLESRQPVDVQTLQGQKRELQMQLEREENEKHELFLQINQLIGQLADTRGQEPSKEVIEENQQLKDKLQILESEYQNLKNGNNTSEKSLQNAENELSTLKDELQRVRATHDLEKNRLNQEIVDYQKELQIKSAALQSLRLAKQEPKEDPAVVSRLTAENSSLKQELDTTNSQLDTTKSQLADASSKLAIIQKSSEESAQKISDLTQNLTTLQIRLDKAEKIASEKSHEFEKQKEEIVLLGSSKSNELSDLQRNLEEKSKKIEELTKSLSETRSSAESSQTLADEISHKLTVANHRIEDLEAGLKDKDQSYMDVENRLKTLQTELRLAKTGSESKNSELENVRGKIDELEEQLKKTKFELEAVKEEKISLQDQVSKKASELELVQKDVEGFKQKIQNLEKENHRLMEKASLEEELMTLVNSLQAARTEITSKETEITELRQKLHDQQDESDRLTTELRHAQTALNHSQEENNRLAAQDIQLSDYRVESEKRLEQIRKELSDELEQARNETSQWRSEAQSLKSKSEKLEMELKEIAHMSEVRHSKSQELEVEKKRLETLLEETCEKLKDVEKQKSHESDLKAKAEDLVSSLKPLEFQLSLKTNELEATQKELASKLNELEALKMELAKKQDKLEGLESEHLALKTVNESTKTDDAVKLAKIEADLQAQRTAKNQLDEELRETLTKLSTAETTLAIAEKAKSTLEIELTDLKQQHVLLNERVAQYGTDKISSEAKIEELKKKLSESEKELSGSSDLAKELVGVKTKLSEVEAKLEVTENNLEGVQKQLKEKEDRLKEEEAKAQGYAKMEMEIGVLRTSLGQMQTQFGVNDTEKQELKDKITELTFELEQRQVDHDKLVKSESYVNLLKQEKSELEQTLALMESKLDEAEKSLEQQMGAREEELRSQLEVLKIKLGDAEEEKKKSGIELEKAKMEYTEGLKKAQEEANDNVRRLTELLSAEAKRSENVSKEKENLQTQAEDLKKEKERLQEKLKLLEAELDKKPEAVSSDDELRQKVNELMEENARLAGDLLKQQRDTSSDDEIRREYEKILLQKQQDWNRQKSALEAKLDEAATTAEKNADTVKAIKVEKEGLEEELKKLKVNGNGEPVAKPRKFTASLSNLTYDTMSERSITPSHDEEEIKKLRTELEKQKRLVTVLRKKIQQPQIEAKIQSRSSMSPIGSNGSVTPNRF